MREMRLYRGYSMIIGSELPLPELPEADGEPDVVIRIEKLARIPRKATLDYELAIHLRTGVYEIRNGREIAVDPLPEADPAGVRVLLLGRIMAYLMRQKGWLPLHAGGVSIDGHGVLFLGKSGAGKSTLTAACHAAGHSVLTDDVAPTRVMGEDCFLSRGRPRLRLDASARSIMDNSGAPSTLEWDNKYCFELDPGVAVENHIVRRIYVLEDSDCIGLEAVPAVNAVQFLSAHSFVKRRLLNMEAIAAHLRLCAAIAGVVPLMRLKRPRKFSALPQVVEFVRNDISLQ